MLVFGGVGVCSFLFNISVQEVAPFKAPAISKPPSHKVAQKKGRFLNVFESSVLERSMASNFRGVPIRTLLLFFC